MDMFWFEGEFFDGEQLRKSLGAGKSHNICWTNLHLLRYVALN